MNTKIRHPYVGKAERAFWKAAVAEKHVFGLEDIWEPPPLARESLIATAGSCFAQHIGVNLKARGANFLDLEPAPKFFRDNQVARRWGFGVYSCRYGNIYSSKQLLQLFDEAFGARLPEDIIWEKDKRFFDALRPTVDPVGQTNKNTISLLREKHLERVRVMFLKLDFFVFTLGMTEIWERFRDGTIFPTAPGVVAGTFDPGSVGLRNLRQRDVLGDLEEFWGKLREVNPSARLLLTVSPVPLKATATNEHVLPANAYSKSVLRSAAGEMAEAFDGVYYFPSYEIITSLQSRGIFFESNLREVSQYGVDLVMAKFFTGQLAEEFPTVTEASEEATFDLVCDDDRI